MLLRIKLLLVAACVSLSLSLSAQITVHSIKGSVSASVSNEKLQHASIVVLHATDSIFYKFTKATQSGEFLISNLLPGKYIIQISYPDYVTFSERFSVDAANREIDFKVVALVLKSRLLQEVIISGTKSAVRLNGDTTEYNASSFVVQPNARVEDLLKKMPGFQVDRSGKITAQGAIVDKVLVDGEEFFGDDPTLVTRNVRADMVQTVQLYDRQNDQNALTGINDGSGKKTVNLKLKEDKKQGYFGKLKSGFSVNSYYEQQAMINVFQDKLRLAAYGTLANNGVTGLGWEDNSAYGSLNMDFDANGMAVLSGAKDDMESFNGRYDGVGKPVSKNGGLHFGNKWNKDKETLSADYKIGRLGVKGDNTTFTANNLASGSLFSNTDQNFDNDFFRQKLAATYTYKPDTINTFKFNLEGVLKDISTKNSFDFETLDANKSLLNDGSRSTDKDEDDDQYKLMAFWSKKLKKKGRTLSLKIDNSFRNTKSTGFLFAQTQYNVAGAPFLENIDQSKNNLIKNGLFRGNLTYSEPFTKSFTGVFNYEFRSLLNEANRQTFDKDGQGSYTLLNNSLSSNYKVNQAINELGMIYNFKRGKSIVNFGGRSAINDYSQKELLNQGILNRTFYTVNPLANYQYKAKGFDGKISYNGTTNLPGIEQLQPVVNNSDPINIFLGNPVLKPSFNNLIKLAVQHTGEKSKLFVGLISSFGIHENPIVYNTTTDEAGKSTYFPVNIGDSNFTKFDHLLTLGKRIGKKNTDLSLELGSSGSKSYNFVNNLSNTFESAVYSSKLSFTHGVEEKYDLSLQGGPSYNIAKSSLQALDDNGSGFLGSADLYLYLPGKVNIVGSVDYEYRSKTDAYPRKFERAIINARLEKQFFKSRELTFAVAVNDLLNQNKGFDRMVSGSMITQNYYTSIRRYCLFSLMWDFNVMGQGKK